MSNLKTLIRLQKQTVDEHRRRVAELQENVDALRDAAVRLEQELVREQDAARDDFMAAVAFSGYLKRALQRRQAFAGAIEDAERHLADARDAMAEAFQEMKRYELAEEARAKREREEERRKEEALLDETASIGFRRRREAEAMEG